MIEATGFAAKKVAVFGMGMSGLAAARALLAGGASVIAWDDSERGRAAASAGGFALCDLAAADWSRIDALVLAPGVPLTHPEPHWTVKAARAHSVEVVGDIEIFVRERRRRGRDTKLVAITGTNGKSTTTALTHHLLQSSGVDAVLGGNIGKPVLDLPDFKPGRCYVVEMSSFQLDLTPSLDADVAILLNIAPDHLDRHGTMANYAAVKETVFAHLPASGTAIVGADDAFCDAVAERVAARRLNVLRISCRSRVSNGVCLTGAALTEMVDGRIRNRASLDGIGSLRGAHNAQNAAAAMTAASSLGVSWDVLSAALRSFPGLPHRMEEVRRIGNVLFINDSKATNADAAERALASFSNIYWIAGGKPKEGGIASLAPYFGRIRRVYLIGEAAAAFEATLDGKVAAVRSGTLDKAVAQAAADAAGDETEAAVVLLSPACASYDQFRNFEVRGDAFRKLVAALPSQAAQDRAA